VIVQEGVREEDTRRHVGCAGRKGLGARQVRDQWAVHPASTISCLQVGVCTMICLTTS